jgi:hypothetical protein
MMQSVVKFVLVLLGLYVVIMVLVGVLNLQRGCLCSSVPHL